MRNLLLAGGLVAALALPAVASAQTRCERDEQSNRVAGTVAGGVLGALAGSAIAGRGDSTAGIIIGGTAGAVAGNQLSRGQPCPPGYYEQPTSAPLPDYGPPTNPFWSQAPAGIDERIDYLQARIRAGVDRGYLNRREAAQAYRDLADIRRTTMDLRVRDGDLNRADRNYLQSRLDTVGDRVRWAERRG